MSVPGTYYLDTPASVDGPLSYAFTIFGNLGASLLIAEWLWRTIWLMIERPHPYRHPISAVRLIWALFLISSLMRIVPDALLVVLWPDIEPATRYALSRANRLFDGFSIAPLAIAWVASIISAEVVDFQLVRRPLPVNLWPSWARLRRPIGIGVMLVIISGAIAFIR